jgi:hypothetical protein
LRDESLRRILIWLTITTRGGPTRGRIIEALRMRPMNAHQLATFLHLDYSTVRHHLDILLEHQVARRVGSNYASAYFLSDEVAAVYPQITKIWETMGKRYTPRPFDVPRGLSWSELTG